MVAPNQDEDADRAPNTSLHDFNALIHHLHRREIEQRALRRQDPMYLPSYPWLHDGANITDGEVSSPPSPASPSIPTNLSRIEVLMLSEANDAAHSYQDSSEDSVFDEFSIDIEELDLSVVSEPPMYEVVGAHANDVIDSAIAYPGAAIFDGDDETVSDVLVLVSDDADEILSNKSLFYLDALLGFEIFMDDENASSTVSPKESSSSIPEDVDLHLSYTLEQFKRKYINSDSTDRFDSERFPVNELGYRDCDVILGRGPEKNKHPGNMRLRNRAMELENAFHSTKSKKKKKEMSKMVLDSVLMEGVRFLAEISPSNKNSTEPSKYTEVGYEKARLKVRTLLYEGEYSPDKGKSKREKHPRKRAASDKKRAASKKKRKK